tara:strand:- start:1814 stop:2119 length:306 start_codon:yes stop_codon:yes gene_type:complete
MEEFYQTVTSPCKKYKAEILVQVEDFQEYKEPDLNYRLQSFEVSGLWEIEGNKDIKPDYYWVSAIGCWGWQEKALQRVFDEDMPEKWHEQRYLEWQLEKND